jgi:pimeloyl-ACP methyl ester carboxylesterase
LEILLYILIISIIGISILFLLFSYFLQRTFHIPHVYYKNDPGILNPDFREHRINTEHDKTIQLWEVNPGADKPPVLFTHGWANASDSFLPLVPAFLNDWNVFLLNTRNHGDSEDDRYSSILQFREDIEHAVDFILKSRNKAQIVLIGHSLGAAASLFTASKKENISAVVSIGTFSNMESFMIRWLRRHGLPRIFISGIIRFIELRAGIRFSDISPDHTIHTYKGPVLLIHGTQDETVPFNAIMELQRAADRENVKILKLKGHTHSSMLKDLHVAKDILQFLSTSVKASEKNESRSQAGK